MKNTFILLLLLSVSIHTYAQENWLFSPRLGINLVPVDDGDVAGQTYKSGLNVGFTAHQMLEKGWIFNYELSFNQRYASYTSTNESDALSSLLPDIVNDLGFDLTIYESTKALSTFWTVDLPISATYKFESGFLFHAGGYVNYLMSVNNDEEMTTHVPIVEAVDLENFLQDPALIALLPENETITTTNDSKSNFNNLGYGIMAGFGYQSDSWLVKFTYQHGMRDIGTDEIKDQMIIKNQRAFNLSVSYLIQDLFTTSKNKARYDLELIE